MVLSFVIAIATTIGLSPPLRAGDFDESKANKVKAAYLYNFSKFKRRRATRSEDAVTCPDGSPSLRREEAHDRKAVVTF